MASVVRKKKKKNYIEGNNNKKIAIKFSFDIPN